MILPLPRKRNDFFPDGAKLAGGWQPSAAWQAQRKGESYCASKSPRTLAKRVVKSSQALQSPPSDDELDSRAQTSVAPRMREYSHQALDFGGLLQSSLSLPDDDDHDGGGGELEDNDDVEMGQRAARLPTPPSPTSTACSETFEFPPPQPLVPFGLSYTRPPLARGTKRPRPLLDISGPNTASLAIKKRRLRSDLITSRLSQPFSHPASHILNREGIKSGDKRFLRLATARSNVHTASVWRYALVNRLRRRLGLGRPGTALRAEGHGDGQKDNDRVESVNVGDKSTWSPQSLQAVSGGKYIRPGGDDTHATRTNQHQCPQGGQEFNATNTDHSRPAPSGRLHETGQADEHDQDEDSMAYWYLDEDFGERSGGSDDVYSDFSMIFRAKSPSEPQSPDEHSEFEEYLDELDGISWVR